MVLGVGVKQYHRLSLIISWIAILFYFIRSQASCYVSQFFDVSLEINPSTMSLSALESLLLGGQALAQRPLGLYTILDNFVPYYYV